MELIDRRKLVNDFWKGVEDGSILSYEDTDDLMENAPTVDAVEVVRCKDCVLHTNCFVEQYFIATRIDNPFCCVGKPKCNSFGERKDNE